MTARSRYGHSMSFEKGAKRRDRSLFLSKYAAVKNKVGGLDLINEKALRLIHLPELPSIA